MSKKKTTYTFKDILTGEFYGEPNFYVWLEKRRDQYQNGWRPTKEEEKENERIANL